MSANQKINRIANISEKLEQEAKRKEEVWKAKFKHHNKSTVNLYDVEERAKVDEVYFESIKAKLALLNIKHEDNQTNPPKEAENTNVEVKD